ncbi:hypothetical protein KCV07_g19, partial [Aureobasidium melanogenum]
LDLANIANSEMPERQNMHWTVKKSSTPTSLDQLFPPLFLNLFGRHLSDSLAILLIYTPPLGGHEVVIVILQDVILGLWCWRNRICILLSALLELRLDVALAMGRKATWRVLEGGWLRRCRRGCWLTLLDVGDKIERIENLRGTGDFWRILGVKLELSNIFRKREIGLVMHEAAGAPLFPGCPILNSGATSILTKSRWTLDDVHAYTQTNDNACIEIDVLHAEPSMHKSCLILLTRHGWSAILASQAFQ